jgi:DNA mismatch repair ATPase MutS
MCESTSSLCESTQVGAFYEAYGFDAVLLVQYCGLNRMGKDDGITSQARSGTSLVNLNQLLRDLTSNGLSCVVRPTLKKKKLTLKKTQQP